MEEFSPPLVYIDILINRKDYNELLHFYDTYPEVREYLGREDKLELLSRQSNSIFATFNDFREHYYRKMMNILPEDDMIEFALEFLTDTTAMLLINNLKNIELVLRKFRIATLKEDYTRVRKLARIIYAKRGNILLSDLIVAKDRKKAESVINEELGTNYNFNPEKGFLSEHGDLKRIISLLNSGDFNSYDKGVGLLNIYNYHLGGTEEEFRQVLTSMKSFEHKPEMYARIKKKLTDATLSLQMRADADRYLSEIPQTPVWYNSPLQMFDMLLNNEIDIDQINSNFLIEMLLAADEKAVYHPYPTGVEKVIKLILSRITIVPLVKSRQFKRIIL